MAGTGFLEESGAIVITGASRVLATLGDDPEHQYLALESVIVEQTKRLREDVAGHEAELDAWFAALDALAIVRTKIQQARLCAESTKEK